MPDPVKAPPESRVSKLVSEVTQQLWEKFDEHPSYTSMEREKRGVEMITYLCRELALEKYKNEILEKR